MCTSVVCVCLRIWFKVIPVLGEWTIDLEKSRAAVWWPLHGECTSHTTGWKSICLSIVFSLLFLPSQIYFIGSATGSIKLRSSIKSHRYEIHGILYIRFSFSFVILSFISVSFLLLFVSLKLLQKNITLCYTVCVCLVCSFFEGSR